MDEPVHGASVRELINHILTRYGSVDAFCHHLHALLGAPTLELPTPVMTTTTAGGRHRLR